MTGSFSKRNVVWAIAAISVVLAPSFAFAGGKSGAKQAGTDRPTESTSLNYGKVEHTYTQKSKASPSSGGSARRTSVKNAHDR
jgi:hypothetical protein